MLFQTQGICPVCNNTGKHWCSTKDWEYRSTNDDYSYLKCIECESIFLKELKLNDLSTIYPPDYYSYSDGPQSGLFRMKDWLDSRYYKFLLNKIPGKDLAVLDIGGGTGQVLDSLKVADHRISYTEIVDIDIKAKKFAEKKGHVYNCARIENYNPNRKFDVILLLNIIEHIGEPKMLIQKTSTLLSANGIIIVKTPNADSLDARLFRRNYWGGLHCPRHWIIFSEKSFRLLLSASNLSLQSIKYTQGAAFWAYSITNMFRRKNISIPQKPLINSPWFMPLSISFAVFDSIRSLFSKTSQMFIILKA